MHRHARLIGTVLLAIGLAVLLSFGYYAVATHRRVPQGADGPRAQSRQRDVRSAVLRRRRRSSCSCVGGAVGGALLALNGVTWIALGAAVGRVEAARRTRSAE